MPVSSGSRIMSQAYVIEVRSRTAGIVVRDGHRFNFFAATPDFGGLEGQAFRTPKEAEAAALRHISARRGRKVALVVGGR